MGSVTATVLKNVQLANPVTLFLTPYSVPEAIELQQPLPVELPPESNLTNNYARCKAQQNIKCTMYTGAYIIM